MGIDQVTGLRVAETQRTSRFSKRQQSTNLSPNLAKNKECSYLVNNKFIICRSHFLTDHFSISSLNPLAWSVVGGGSGDEDRDHSWSYQQPQTMGSETAPARKVIVLADPTRESAVALQYALSNVVLENDELILLHVETPNSWRKNTLSFLRRSSLPSHYVPNLEGGEIDFLEAMKQVCEVAQPGIRIRKEKMQMEAKVKDKDKANAILVRCNTLGVDAVIIGQRRSLSSALLGIKRSGSAGLKAFDMAEYLIENSKCNCVGVQKKGQNAGYLINTKTQKNFWLLA